MKLVMKSVLCLAVATLALPALAAELGDKAAPLSIKEWIKGSPVEIKADGPTKAYVVEFWATWCPPCRTSIPHLTEMAKKFKDKGVVIIGVSDEDPKKVKPFVEKMGTKMDYVVAIDNDRATSKAYMAAYGQGGIPAAFVVDQKGKVVWVGHPMIGLEQVVEKVVSGTSDPAVLKEVAEKAEADFRKGQEDLKKVAVAVEEYLRGIKGGSSATFDESLIKTEPKYAPIAGVYNQLAWVIMTEEGIKDRNLSLALKAAKAADDLTGNEDPAILDTYAMALWKTGQKAEGLKVQEKAVKLCMDEEMKAELQKHLDEYQAGLGKQDK